MKTAKEYCDEQHLNPANPEYKVAEDAYEAGIQALINAVAPRLSLMERLRIKQILGEIK